MPKVQVKLKLMEGEGCQVVIKIGNETLDFQKSGTKTVDLDAKRYTTLIAGFQDPASSSSTVRIEFLQEQTLLNSITISEQSFIKSLRITVK